MAVICICVSRLIKRGNRRRYVRLGQVCHGFQVRYSNPIAIQIRSSHANYYLLLSLVAALRQKLATAKFIFARHVNHVRLVTRRSADVRSVWAMKVKNSLNQ